MIGNTGLQFASFAVPMSIIRMTEWPPTFGVLWQLLQVPTIRLAEPATLLNPLHAADDELVVVEDLLAAVDRAARLVTLVAVAVVVVGEHRPGVEDVEHLAVERRAGTGWSFMPSVNGNVDRLAGPPSAPRRVEAPRLPCP